VWAVEVVVEEVLGHGSRQVDKEEGAGVSQRIKNNEWITA
jgi:hypothetical protein